MSSRLAVGAAVAAVLALGAGCADDDASPSGTVDERAQVERRTVRDVARYCGGADRSRRARRQAVGAVERLVSDAARYRTASYEEQLPVRRLMAATADFLESERCLTRLVPGLDRALRQMPLPSPPAAPESDYEPQEDEPPGPRP